MGVMADAAFNGGAVVPVAANDNTWAVLSPANWSGKPVPERRWMLDSWVPTGHMTLVTGAGSAGKSLLMQQLCTCIATGTPFLGIKVEQANALYVTCEDDADELHRRQVSICEALGLSLPSLEGRLHLSSRVGEIDNPLVAFERSGVMSELPSFDGLKRTIELTGAKFVVLDNVAHLFAGNEIVRNEVAGFCGLLNALAAEIDGSVILIGHPNKSGADYSGSTAWENQVRSRLFLEVPGTDKDGACPDTDLRVLKRGKANYASRGGELSFRWHRMAFVLESHVPTDTRREIEADARAASDNEVFLNCLRVRNEQRRAVSENRASRTYAPREFAKMTEAKGVSEARLEAALDRLYRLNKIERGELWRDGHRKFVSGLREVAGDV